MKIRNFYSDVSAFRSFGVLATWLSLLFCFGNVLALDVCIDNEAPSAPSGLGVSGNVGSILLEWDEAVDSPECSGIFGYNVSRNGEWLGFVEGLSFVDEDDLGAGDYRYSVYAIDLAGKNAGASIVNVISVSSGGGGSSGGSRSSGFVCEVDWICEEWSECFEGFRSRECVDLNDCRTPYLKPVVMEDCEMEEEEEEIVKVEDEEVDEGFFSAMTGAVIGGGAGGLFSGLFVLLLIGVTIFVIVRRKSVVEN